MANRPLAEIITEMFDGDRVHLPVQPALVNSLLACLSEEGAEASRFWSMVSDDPSLVCGLFRAANSSFYAGLPKTLSIDEAVTRLGLDKAARVVETTCREIDGGQGELVAQYMPSLWLHARGCGLGARWLAERCGYQGLADQAYLGGLLHDIGKIFLLAAMQKIASGGDSQMELSEQLVLEVISTMHVEQGLRLFDEWSLPEAFRDVVAEHHEEELDNRNILVALVKLANKGCRKVGLGLDTYPDIVLPTTGEAQFLGIDEIALAEFEIMLEDRFL